MKVIYRISSNGYKKTKLPFATKKYCLQNAIEVFGQQNIHLFIDTTNLADELKKDIEDLGLDLFGYTTYYSGGSSAGSFRYVLDYAMTNLLDDTRLLLSEDDYLWLPSAPQIMQEGFDREIDYLAPYLHPDRFIPASQGGNPYIDDDGAFATRCFKTANSFWVQVESTTLTFNCTVATLKRDWPLWDKWTNLGHYPQDHKCFCELTAMGRSVASPIPTQATHIEVPWVSPLIGTGYADWKQV